MLKDPTPNTNSKTWKGDDQQICHAPRKDLSGQPQLKYFSQRIKKPLGHGEMSGISFSTAQHIVYHYGLKL